MAYKQPRVPLLKEGTKLTEYIRELVLFLKDFCLETWSAVMRLEKAGERPVVTSVNEMTGDVYLTAPDIGALEADAAAADSEKLGGKAPEYYIQPRNLLDNADFTRFIAQAGIAEAHAAGTVYAGDRWVLDSGTVTASADGGGYKAVTLNGTIRQLVADAPADATAAVGMVSGTAQIQYANGAVTITSSGGVLKWAALYEGAYTQDTLPPYRPKGYAAELLECRRYYRMIVANNATPANAIFTGFLSSDKTRLYLPLPSAAGMRAHPRDVTISGGIIIRSASGGYYTEASYSSPYVGAAVTSVMSDEGNTVGIVVGKSDNTVWNTTAVNNSVMSMILANGAKIVIDADL